MFKRFYLKIISPLADVRVGDEFPRLVQRSFVSARPEQIDCVFCAHVGQRWSSRDVAARLRRPLHALLAHAFMTSQC